MTYAEALARLTALRGGEHVGMRPGLERIEGLLEALGHPETQYALVQVGGTNGKGTTAATLATILKAAGRRVGLYTSPHLVSFRERVRVNGEPIPEDAVADGVEAIGTLVARFDATMFEATTALALDHFAREAVEVAVLEVGLGGRLDATTVGRPVATIVSRVDLDHEAVLGPTLAAIAAEKAAIIRSGVALSAAQAPEVSDVIARRAQTVGVPLRVEGRDLHVAVRRRSLGSQVLACRGPSWAFDGLVTRLAGTYQASNVLLAVAAAAELGVDEAAIRTGLARVEWPGRFQLVGREPTIVLDSAHNPAGAQALAASLREYFPGRDVTLIVGVSRDKNAAAILAPLAPLARRMILTRARHPRAADPDALRALAPASAQTAPGVAEALALARRPPTSPVICVAGSIFLVGEALVELQGVGNNPCRIENPADSIETLFS